MSRTPRTSRRAVLRGLLAGSAVTVGLPWLETFAGRGNAWAVDDAFPRRFGLFYWGNGNLPDRWIPSQTGFGDDWALSEQLAPLASVKEQLTVVTGLDVKVPNVGPHLSGIVGMLTGMTPPDGEDDGGYPGPTLDRWLAQRIGGTTRFRSIEAGAGSDGRSYEGAHQQSPAENSPYALYQRLFGAGFFEPGEEPIIDPTWALRRSVLDAVAADADRMKTRVSADDRQRLQQHLDGVRELELRLARLEDDPPDLASCRRPDAPLADYPDLDGRPQLREKNRVISQLLAMACACDQVRVVSNWFSSPVSDLLYPGATMGHHQLTHDEPGDQAQVHQIVIQIMQSFADMIEAFRAIPEGDGTLLDHMVILGTSDVSLGRTHSIEDYPILLAGSAGGRFHTNQHVRSSGGESVSKVNLSIIRAMGLSEPAWGTNDNRVTDGLTAIET
ncbi:MAG: DUF1552 domain-containing protein [Alphaproteobacteria bacterium]|nr:DUF1552 domain-containing protein [Alphaproteobacteria bacterium]